jgi:hypothetical protein
MAIERKNKIFFSLKITISFESSTQILTAIYSRSDITFIGKKRKVSYFLKISAGTNIIFMVN